MAEHLLPDMIDKIRKKANLPSPDSVLRDAFNDPEVQNFLMQNKISQDQMRREHAKIYEFYHEKQLIRRHAEGVAPGYYLVLLF